MALYGGNNFIKRAVSQLAGFTTGAPPVEFFSGSATAGTTTISGNNVLHMFTASGNFYTSGSGYKTINYAIIGGGGGGGYNNGGGGGAGGVRTGSISLNGVATYTITVGGGASGATSAVTNKGSDSSGLGYTAEGGGGGGYYACSNGQHGGSGGGAGGGSGCTSNGGTGSLYGNSGGANAGYGPGGGGGAGSAGVATTSNGNPSPASTATGGAGVYIFTEISPFYLGGGGGGGGGGTNYSGGCSDPSVYFGNTNNTWGGGYGAQSDGQELCGGNSGLAMNGTANKGGGGGGGGGYSGKGGNGGSGMVLIWYVRDV